MTLINMVVEAAAEIGLPEPASVIGNPDNNVRQMLRAANKSGQILAREYDWQDLLTEHTFVTTAAEAQVGALPTDFDHFSNGTMFNRTTQREVIGPITPEDWQREKSTVTGLTVYDAFRIRGNDLLLTPTPPAGETIAYEYIKKHWVDTYPLDGVCNAEAFVTDQDTIIFPERLVVLGIIWRFLAMKGLQYGEQRSAYSSEVLKTMGRDGGAPRLPMGRRRMFQFPTNVPETGYGS
jgi:hypothetical protein